jgi:phosphohistidine phosphatase
MNARQEVQVHLLRHAHAGDPARWDGPDSERPLSAKGRLQAERLGAFLLKADFAPDLVLSSPKLRAAETARLVADQLGLSVELTEALAGPIDVADLDDLLTSVGNPYRPLLVGHDPDFSALAEELSGAILPLRKGALARIDASRPLRSGTGVLRWLVPPDLLEGCDSTHPALTPPG